jgi:carbon-monoxide dehydrogenase small subunit
MTLQQPCKDPRVSAEDRIIRLKVNGVWHKFYVGHDIEEADTLAYLLREKLGLSGLKVACDEGACGACTVILNGEAVLSCMTLAVDADGQDILTIEGLPKDDPVIAAFAEQSEPGYGTAMQCGYCTPGFVMTVKSFLNENPNPTAQEIKDALSGNICRCGCYAGIAKSVEHAAEKISRQESKP